MDIEPREQRSHLIGRFIQSWLNGVIDKQQAFADDVRRVYFAMVPDPSDRNIHFHQTDDALHDLRENRQVVMRRLRGDIKFECDFEECVIEALPAGPRAELLRLLCARYGLLAVPIPHSAVPGVAADLARLAKEFGEAVHAIGDLIEGDGVIDEHDSPVLLKKSLAETDDLLAAATTFRESVADALRKQEVCRGRGRS